MNSNSINTSSIVTKVWAFCNTLRDDGVGYGSCLKQDFQDSKISRIGRALKIWEILNQASLDSDILKLTGYAT